MKNLLKRLAPNFIWNWYHFLLAFLGALIYGWPSRKIKVIGVTGTKGKSTTVILAGKILGEAENFNLKEGENINPPRPSFEKGGSNAKVGWISSLTVNDGQKEVLNPYHMTMPGRFFIQKTLARMVKNGCEYAIVEVTSEGIKQHRHRFIKWTGVVFTNLAPEHLEAHGGFEKYRAAKGELFKAATKNKESFGVYNLDDENARYFLEYAVGKKYGYTMGNNFQFPISHPTGGHPKGDNFQKIFNVKNVQLNANGSEFEIDGVKFKTNLLGEFNVRNCAAAVTIGAAAGVSIETAARALEKVQSIPGRLELIDEGQDFTVVVDLAHTPDSFEKVFGLFRSIKYQHPFLALPSSEGRGKIISVFGSAGGGRDKWKRPELGRIACENSDVVILCNEDPYHESPGGIAQDIAAGCKNIQPEIVLDRKEAIAKAAAVAEKNDILLILGKGTEQTMVIGDKKILWDDREVVREILKDQLCSKDK